MRKDDPFPTIRVILLVLIVLYFGVKVLFPDFFDNLRGLDTKDYRSIVLNKLKYYDDEQSKEFYRGFYTAHEYYEENMMDFVKDTDTYHDIWDEGYKSGYSEGYEKGMDDAIDTAEDWYEP